MNGLTDFSSSSVNKVLNKGKKRKSVNNNEVEEENNLLPQQIEHMKDDENVWVSEGIEEEENIDYELNDVGNSNELDESIIESNYRELAMKSAMNNSNSPVINIPSNNINSSEIVELSDSSDEIADNQALSSGGEVTIELDMNNNTEAKDKEKPAKPKSQPKPKPKLSVREQFLVALVWRCSLISYLNLLFHQYKFLDCEEIQCLIYSLLLPQTKLLQTIITKSNTKQNQNIQIDYLKNLTEWFKSLFTHNAKHSELSVNCAKDSASWQNYFNCGLKQLTDCISNVEGGSVHLILIYGALLRHLGMKVRLIRAIPTSAFDPTALFDSNTLNEALNNLNSPCACSQTVVNKPSRVVEESDMSDSESSSVIALSNSHSNVFIDLHEKQTGVRVNAGKKRKSSNSDESACIVCGETKSIKSNPIIYCDYCNNEQHLKCSIPKLKSVPKGKFRCNQCKNEQITEEKSSSKQKKNRKSELSDSEEESLTSNSDEDFESLPKTPAKNKSKKAIPVYSWLEVYSPSESRWIAIDPVNGLIDQPKSYETKLNIKFAFVISVMKSRSSDGYIVKDVTKRYSVKWATSLRRRNTIEESWWSLVQRLLSSKLSENDISLDALEDEELDKVTVNHDMPNSLAGFKNHPLYIIEPHLKKFECIHPQAEVVAKVKFKGKEEEICVYNRSNLHTLHTKDRWIREGRKLRLEEESNPVKSVKSHGIHKKKQLLPVEEKFSNLYGIWQTDPYKPAAARDGIVPKNERGNIDLWDPSHLPDGCVHLNYPRIRSIAVKLGIDSAEAMTGFDVKGGRSIPIFAGIVVCKEYANMIMDAYWEREKCLEENSEKKKIEKILFNWKNFIKRSITRIKVMKLLKEREKEQQEQKQPKQTPIKANMNSVNTANNSTHIHEYSSRSFNSESSEWISQCSCGAIQEYEEL